MRAWATLSVSLALLLVSCDVGPSEIVDLVDEPENIVTVGNDANAFAFSVQARDLTLDQTYELRFQSDTTSIGLAVVGYGGGRGTIELLDADGVPIYTRSLATNTAEGNGELCFGHPVRARLQFAGYTGIVAIGVSAD